MVSYKIVKEDINIATYLRIPILNTEAHRLINKIWIGRSDIIFDKWSFIHEFV